MSLLLFTFRPRLIALLTFWFAKIYKDYIIPITVHEIPDNYAIEGQP